MGQVAGVHFLVGRVFGAHHPSVRRAGGRGDEEELVHLWSLEQALGAMQLLLAQDGGRLAEVDSWSDIPIQEPVALQRLADGDCVVVGAEGTDDAAQ